jgi:hypothetical protein
MTKWTILEQGNTSSGTRITAELKANGDLHLSGVDFGDDVERSMGDWDYEYWLTIPAKDLAPALVVVARHAMGQKGPLFWSTLVTDLREALGTLDEGSWI